MPANTQHTKYKTNLVFWTRLRDCVAGEDAVKARGSVYLPVLNAGEDKEYQAYKTRAAFYSATGRTVDGLQGAIMRKPAKVEWPEAEKERLLSIGRAGESFNTMASHTIRDNLTTGRFGLLVDAPDDENAEYQSYVAIYAAEDIINWRQDIVKGKKVLTMVVLAETYEHIDPLDSFRVETLPQWRVLHLGTGPAYDVSAERPRIARGFTSGDATTPFYYQEIWRENPDKSSPVKLILWDTITPRMTGGRLLTEIPFAFANAADNDVDPCEPALLDLANVNLSHYRTSADLEHGLHFTALPTAWFAGFEFNGEVHIGSTVAYSTTNEQAKAGFLEFSGSGLSALKEAMADKEKQMASLGSRMLEAQKASAEAAATIQLRSAGEQSALTLIADACSAAWTCALRWLYQWGKAAPDAGKDIKVTFNTEFTVVTLGASDLSALVQTAQGGLMSWDTFFYNLQRGGLIAEGVTPDEERASIENEGLPAGLGLAMSGGLPPGAPTPSGGPPIPPGGTPADDNSIADRLGDTPSVAKPGETLDTLES